MKRALENLVADHFSNEEKMVFVSGPRQVGKTTVAKSIEGYIYINWDKQTDRAVILKGADAVAEHAGVSVLSTSKIGIIFDEIHKYSKWKSFLKGFYDFYKDRFHIIVTGSSRLNVFKKGGDSLMGRYFLYRLYPLTVAEIFRTVFLEEEIHSPKKTEATDFQNLLEFGGFPEPFLKGNIRFYNRWKRLRMDQLFQEDLRDISKIHEIGQMQVLADLIANQSGQLVNYSNLATKINVSVDTIKRWIGILESVYYCFTVKPWFRNIPKTLIKQPKVYLIDWALLKDVGAKHENFVAMHLLKAVHWWTDCGFGDYGLFFLRDKNQREVDFLVTKNNEPWFMVEVKSSDCHISPNLFYYQKLLKLKHAFQLSFSLEYIDQDCFSVAGPVVVPAKTFLSQLI